MYSIRIHGRGGQGVVTAAELLSLAAFAEGQHAQAFPSFGSERTGAPIVAFCRIDGRRIRLREPILEADAVIVQDPTLLGDPKLFAGLSPKGFALVGSPKTVAELELSGHPWACYALPGAEIAMAQLGRPLANVPLLGGFAALSGQLSIEALERAVRERFGKDIGERNVKAARAGFDWVRGSLSEGRRAQTA